MAGKYDSMTFKKAFNAARKEKGAGKVFTYKGKRYTTNLKEEEKKLAKPLRLSSYRVKKGDTYKSLALKSNIANDAEDQLRLINGDYPDKPLSIGRVIKIVQ